MTHPSRTLIQSLESLRDHDTQLTCILRDLKNNFEGIREVADLSLEIVGKLEADLSERISQQQATLIGVRSGKIKADPQLEIKRPPQGSKRIDPGGEFLSVSAAMELSGCHRRTIQVWCSSGPLRSHARKTRHKWLIERKAFLQHLTSLNIPGVE